VKFTSLKLTQRLRLDPPKLEEVRRRIQLAGNDWSILLGVPGSGNPVGLTGGLQERTLKNLVTYLRQKEAAGVLSLPPNSAHGQETGLLHTFAPCAFAHEYLLQRAPKLEVDMLAEDYVVVILVRVNM
jgi:RNA-binding protein 15